MLAKRTRRRWNREINRPPRLSTVLDSGANCFHQVFDSGGSSALVLGHGRVVDDPRAAANRLDLAARLLDDSDLHGRRLQLAQAVDDDVDEPGTEGAVLLRVLRLLVLRHADAPQAVT